MAPVLGSILEAIGNTPLVRLDRIRPPESASILAKMEQLNPSGSVKARPAYAMVRAAQRQGLLHSGSVLVEASSGNQGIALAMVGAVLGYRVRIVMPEGMSEERTAILRAYGAEVELTPGGEDIGDAVALARARTEELAAANPDVFLTAQFANPVNPQIHAETTAEEVLAALGPSDRIDAFVCGIGTGGTLTGVGRALRRAYPGMIVVAAEPQRAAILSGGPISDHIQQGIGDGLIPEVLDRSLIDEIVVVSDEDAMSTARMLAKLEGLFCGISSGSNVWAAMQVGARLGEPATVLTLCPDAGERYLSMGIVGEEQSRASARSSVY